MRSNHYDLLPQAVQNLKLRIANRYAKADVLRKSKSSDTNFEQVITKFIAANDEEERWGKEVYSQFQALKKDFGLGKINRIFYKEVLKPLNDLLVNRQKKIDDVKNLHAPEIAEELKKMGY